MANIGVKIRHRDDGCARSGLSPYCVLYTSQKAFWDQLIGLPGRRNDASLCPSGRPCARTRRHTTSAVRAFGKVNRDLASGSLRP
jgi:hypothetical protein